MSKTALTFCEVSSIISGIILMKRDRSMDRVKRWLIFNLWYLKRPPWDTGEVPPELQRFIQSHQPGRALDLGCGTGTNLLALAQAGWQVTGIDFALRAVSAARRRLAQAGVPADVRVGDVTELSGVGGPFDLILDIGCYHGLSPVSRSAYRHNLLKYLKPGGTFLLYTHLVEPGARELSGIDEGEVEWLGEMMQLAAREDSRDRWDRRSAWLAFTSA